MPEVSQDQHTGEAPKTPQLTPFSALDRHAPTLYLSGAPEARTQAYSGSPGCLPDLTTGQGNEFIRALSGNFWMRSQGVFARARRGVQT